MGAPAKRGVRCAQCGEPAEDGFARQYCSNRACTQYMPPLTVVDHGTGAGLRCCRARRQAPHPTRRNAWFDVVWPDGYQQVICVYDMDNPDMAESSKPGSTPGNRTKDVWCSWKYYPVWHDCPMVRAILEANQHGTATVFE